MMALGHSVRDWIFGASVVVMATAIPMPALAQQTAYKFDIPAQNLKEALNKFGKTTRGQIVFDGKAVREAQSQLVRGTYGVRQGLDLLLRNTGFAARTGQAGVLVVARADQERSSAPEPEPELSSSAAAPSANPIEDIVVSARRRDERLQDVPIAITAISGAELVARGIDKASDLQSRVPGLFTAPGSVRGSNSPVFAIRGQLNRDPTGTQDPSIGFYFAEVPWARVQGSNAAFLDLQSVQVLKGPQGTLFGRNSTGGAILVTPAAPTDNFEGYIKGTIGDYGLFSGEAVVNLPVSDRLHVRIAGSHQQRRGYLRVVDSGQRANDINNESVRASLKWTPTDNFTSTTIGSFYDTDTASDGSRLIAVAPTAPIASLAALYARFSDGLRRTAGLGKYDIFSSFTPAVAAGQVLGVSQSLGTALLAKVRTHSIQNKSELSLGEVGGLGDITLKNILSYRKVKEASNFDVVAVDFLSNATMTDMRMKQFTEEFQVQGTSDRLNYTIGAFYFRESGHDRSLNYSVVPIASLFDNHIGNTSYSVFAHGEYDLRALAEGLNVTGGVRLNNDRRYLNLKNRRRTTPGVVGNGLFTCVLQPTLPANDGTLCNFPSKKTFRVPTWDAGISYQAAPGSLIYASIARGYRSGGFSTTATSALTATPFGPEKVLNYEVGTKNDFDLGGAVARVNLAGFYSDYRDIQRTVSSLNDAGTLINKTINAARAHIWGAEAELMLKPIPDLEFNVSYTFLRPKYDKFTDLFAETNPAFIPVGQTRVLYPVDVSDSEFILVSRHSFNIGVNYALPVEESIGEITVAANYYYRTSFHTTSDINPTRCTVAGDPNPAAFYANCYNRGGKLPGYGLLNLRADWRNMFGAPIDAAVFVNNVTDKFYFNNAANSLSSFGTLTAQIGAPRMIGASLTYRFD